jgi:hypothetical protein
MAAILFNKISLIADFSSPIMMSFATGSGRGDEQIGPIEMIASVVQVTATIYRGILTNQHLPDSGENLFF